MLHVFNLAREKVQYLSCRSMCCILCLLKASQNIQEGPHELDCFCVMYDTWRKKEHLNVNLTDYCRWSRILVNAKPAKTRLPLNFTHSRNEQRITMSGSKYQPNCIWLVPNVVYGQCYCSFVVAYKPHFLGAHFCLLLQGLCSQFDLICSSPFDSFSCLVYELDPSCFMWRVQWRCTRRPHFSLLCVFCLIVLVSVMTVIFSLSVSVQGWACGGSLFFLLGLSLFAWLPWQLSYFLFWFEGESLRSFCPLVHASYSPSLSVWIHPSILPRGWSPRWLAPKCIFHPRDTVQADSL